MKRAVVAGCGVVLFLALLAGAAFFALREIARPPTVETFDATGSQELPAADPAVEGAHRAALYGRVRTVDGATYEGRLRFGGDEEAFWREYFNGAKAENRWAHHVPDDRRPTVRTEVGILGLDLFEREREVSLARVFMTRLGNIERIEASGDDVRVTLKSGTGLDLDRFEASDFDDGVRVWDPARGVVDLDSLRIRSIDFLSPDEPVPAPAPLHGTVRTEQGDELTGFLQWNREEGAGSDTLDGRTEEGEASLRFDTLRSIERTSRSSVAATLHDGREVVLTGGYEVSEGNRGLYVDDPRYGRVLVPWRSFDRVEFHPGGDGPGYDDFPPGEPLRGTVTTRDGRRLAGRLVYDLDESETTETLDAPARGIDFTIPFGLVASIALPDPHSQGEPRARVAVRSGEVLRLRLEGDLGGSNAGMLVFVDGRAEPEYLAWREVERIDLGPLRAPGPNVRPDARDGSN